MSKIKSLSKGMTTTEVYHLLKLTENIFKDEATYGHLIDYLPEIAQLAVMNAKPQLIRRIKNPSKNVQLESVKQAGWALEFIKKPSKRVILEAVSNNGKAIQWIKNPSEEIKLIAVEQDPLAIQFIPNPSPKVQLIAVKKYPLAAQWIENPTEDVQMVVVRELDTGMLLIKNPTGKVKKLNDKLRKKEIKDNKNKDSNNEKGILLVDKDE